MRFSSLNPLVVFRINIIIIFSFGKRTERSNQQRVRRKCTRKDIRRKSNRQPKCVQILRTLRNPFCAFVFRMRAQYKYRPRETNQNGFSTTSFKKRNTDWVRRRRKTRQFRTRRTRPFFCVFFILVVNTIRAVVENSLIRVYRRW